MSYPATVYKVMIASPSDVPAERKIISDVIHEWNAVHSEYQGIILMPVSWETHSSPEFGRPQEIINKQVLQNADLLVAAFWTRVGTPTGKAPGGTVEEIEEHIATGKPAMIYFSTAPAHIQSIDIQQTEALRKFHQECLSRGLVESYESISEFRDKFNRHLAHVVLRHFAAERSDTDFVAIYRKATLPDLSDTAKKLIHEISQDNSGQLMMVRTRDGLSISTNGQELADRNNARDEARWESSVKELLDAGLLVDRGNKGEIFSLTDKGYSAADLIE